MNTLIAEDVKLDQPQLNTLLPNALATILLDGLIYTAYNQNERLYQAAILTEAEKHHLVVEVRADGKLLFPSIQFPWDSSHAYIKQHQFWLYVDTGKGRPTGNYAAELYKPADDIDPQAYRRVLALEELYHRSLKPDPMRTAIFNLPHGTCYSAKNTVADLMQFEQGDPPSTAKFVRKINVSTLGAIDIAGPRGDKDDSTTRVQGWLVLENEEKEFFRLLLHPNKHYEVKLMNVPSEPHGSELPETHFLQFYSLFKLNPGEKVFMVRTDEKDPLRHPDSPPCVIVTTCQTCKP